MPRDDVTLAALARLPVQALRHVKAEVLAALAQIMPSLADAYARSTSARAGRARHTRQLNQAHAAKNAARRQALAERLAETATVIPAAPQRDDILGGRFDPSYVPRPADRNRVAAQNSQVGAPSSSAPKRCFTD
jgi:hypothetical protein